MDASPASGHVVTDPGYGSSPRRGRSERIYAGLLRAYPTTFRARYGDEMIVLFGDQLRDVQAAQAAGGTTLLWIRSVLDLAAHALGEHLRKDRSMAQSVVTFEPTRTMRVLGLVGVAGGILLLWAFISFSPFETLSANMVRLITFSLAGAAVALAFYRRQARVAKSLTLITTGAVVVSGVLNATLIVLALWVPSPFSSPLGVLNFLTSGALWLSAAVYGAAMLIGNAAWQGMPRGLAIATRLGAVALLGSTVAWAGDDRLGLVDSEQFGQMWSAIATTGVIFNGLGWIILGAVLAFGSGSARRPA